jgi:cystathionine beta-lyase
MLKKALATVVVRPDAASPLAGRRPAVSARASSNASPGGGMRGSHVASLRTASVTLRTLSSRRPHPPAGAPTGRPHRLARGRVQVTTRALFGKKPPASPSPSKDVSVSVRELTETCRRAIKTYGYDDAETQVLLDVMMYAQLRGNNQGIIKVTTKGIARDPDCVPVTTEHETMLSANLNGGKNAGMVVLHRAMQIAAEKAEAHGFGICGTNNTSTSTGALGYYAETLAKRGLIALVFAVSPEFVAPNGAIEPIFGTNPIGVGIPTADGPVVLDMATSAYSFFGLLEARTAGKKIPHGVAIDGKGNITEDPNAAIDGGAIKTFDGGYKSSNLALIVELLAGPLVGAAVQDKMSEKNWGNLVLAIDPKLLGQGEFERRAAIVTARVKGAKKAPGVNEILLPGERGDAFAARVAADGVIDVEPNLWRGLQELASEYDTSVSETSSSAHTTYAFGGSENGAEFATKKRGAGGKNGWGVATRLVHPSVTVEDPFDSTNFPLYQTATFGQPSATTNGPYDYTRSGNPTRDMLEKQMAELENADRAFAFSSGMSALMCVTRLVRTGERIVTGDDIYGGTSRLLAQVVPKVGIEVVNVDMNDLDAVKRAIDGGPTTMVMLESPTNPRLQITDIRSISDFAHAKGALVCVDNSIMAPVFQAPLDLGADICMTSATKFISGQSDVTGGILACRGEQLGKDIYFHQNAEGLHLGPFDCWLALRGLKTMALRMEKQQANAMVIARWLEAHPLVNFVNYPGLESNKGHELHKSQATGAGSILSFATGNVELSRIVVEQAKLFKITVSFGNTSSLISLPCFMSHASIPAEVRAARGLPGRPRPDLHGHRGRRGPHRRLGRGVHHRGARNGRVKF